LAFIWPLFGLFYFSGFGLFETARSQIWPFLLLLNLETLGKTPLWKVLDRRLSEGANPIYNFIIQNLTSHFIIKEIK
jgi:hypothetical protein